MTPPGYREPTFGQRLLARLLDCLLPLPVVALISVAADGATPALIGLVSAVVYEVVLVARYGRTIGKWALGVRVVDVATGGRPPLGQAAWRSLVFFAGSVLTLALPALDLLGLMYTLIVVLPVMRPPAHRGLHDIAAGTIVSSTAPRPSRDRTSGRGVAL